MKFFMKDGRAFENLCRCVTPCSIFGAAKPDRGSLTMQLYDPTDIASGLNRSVLVYFTKL